MPWSWPTAPTLIPPAPSGSFSWPKRSKCTAEIVRPSGRAVGPSPRSKMRKLILLDTDPGIGTPGADVDDGLAIALALLHPGCELLGLTIVAGNVVEEEGLPNALRLLEIAGRTEVPVVSGATRPLLRDPSRIRELMGGRRRPAGARF